MLNKEKNHQEFYDFYRKHFIKLIEDFILLHQIQISGPGYSKYWLTLTLLIIVK
jgi:hypothetical protein